MLWMKGYQTSKNSHQKLKQCALPSGKQNEFSLLLYKLEKDEFWTSTVTLVTATKCIISYIILIFSDVILLEYTFCSIISSIVILTSCLKNYIFSPNIYLYIPLYIYYQKTKVIFLQNHLWVFLGIDIWTSHWHQ